jgi:phage replication-related protein YjqB (UPF0714/DUF867 family)
MSASYPGLASPPPDATATPDRYPSNTALYADPTLVEGVDYTVRYHRSGVVVPTDDDAPVPPVAIIAVHGGGIEPGTSELCLAVAGYHPATLAPTPATGPGYDYWMFEGLRSRNNRELHVTSIHCDDPVVVSLCGRALTTVALHGCAPGQLGLPDDAAAVCVGGRDDDLKTSLVASLRTGGFAIVTDVEGLDGDDERNIVNRNRREAGAQLELTTPLREQMFDRNQRPRRAHTTEVFWRFVTATRAALAA